MTPAPPRKTRDATRPAVAGSARRADIRSRAPARPALDDDAGGYEAFYRATAAPLATYLRYLGATVEEAAEFAQHALVEAVVEWRRIDHPHAWCRTVARRAYHRWVFDARRSDGDVPPESALLADPRAEPACRATEREELDGLVAMVRELPTEQRNVMALSLFGLAPAEIARELGKPPSRVRANLHRARTNLRERLGR